MAGQNYCLNHEKSNPLESQIKQKSLKLISPLCHCRVNLSFQSYFQSENFQMVHRAPQTMLSLLQGTPPYPVTSKAWLCPASKIPAPPRHCLQDLGSLHFPSLPHLRVPDVPPLSTARFLSEETSTSSPSNTGSKQAPSLQPSAKVLTTEYNRRYFCSELNVYHKHKQGKSRTVGNVRNN